MLSPANSATEVDELKDLSYNELQRLIHELESEKIHYQLENEVFENFLTANEPSMIADMNNTLKRAQELQTQGLIPITKSESKSSSISMRTSTRSTLRYSEPIIMARGPRINISQKTDLILRETDAMQNSYQKFIKKTKRIKFNLRAEIEELNIRQSEISDACKALDRMITESYASTTQKLSAEKFVRYMQEWLKSAEISLEKLRLHVLSNKIHLNKIKQQYSQKQELSESVDEADLEQMQIERAHMTSELRTMNVNLVEMKYMNSKANLLLVAHKRILEKQRQQKENTRANLVSTAEKIELLQIEAKQTENEVNEERKKLEDLMKLIATYEVPPVLDYIKAKAELYDLTKELNMWRRRREIQKIGLSTYTKMLCQITGLKKPKPSWFTRDHHHGAEGSDDLQDDSSIDTQELQYGTSCESIEPLK